MRKSVKTPAIFVIRRLIKPSFIKDYEQWLRTATEQVHKFTGNLGVFVIKPMHSHHPEYILVVEFDSEENLDLFKKSEIKDNWLSELEKFSLGPADEQNLSAINSWFKDGNLKYEKDSPAKYKKVILAIATAIPFVIIIRFLVSLTVFNSFYIVNLTVTLTITIIILTYYVNPWLSKKLQFWLYK